MRFPIRLCPSDLSRISLLLERSVTLGPTERERLRGENEAYSYAYTTAHSARPYSTNPTVVSDESDPMTRINRSRTEVAFKQPHPSQRSGHVV